MANTGRVVKIDQDGLIHLELDPDVPQGPRGGVIFGRFVMSPGGAIRFNQIVAPLTAVDEPTEDPERIAAESANVERARKVRDRTANQRPV